VHRSLAFVGLNQLVNERGGFLRKTSTMVTFRLNDKDLSILSTIQRIAVFNLPQEEAEK
jgi:hypothetical protein